MAGKREGKTKVTSVSVSEEFSDIIEKYNLSPTEVFRKGIGVEMHDRGMPKYQSETNHKRSEAIKKFFRDMEEDEVMKNRWNVLIDFAKEIISYNSVNVEAE